MVPFQIDVTWKQLLLVALLARGFWCIVCTRLTWRVWFLEDTQWHHLVLMFGTFWSVVGDWMWSLCESIGCRPTRSGCEKVWGTEGSFPRPDNGKCAGTTMCRLSCGPRKAQK